MAMRSYFAIYHGLAGPAQFDPSRQSPELLAQQDLWDAAKTAPPSLLFRVRSESDPGASVTTADRLESCIGLIDAVTRWRSVWSSSSICVAAVRQPALAAAIQQAMGFISTQHPANVNQVQRQQMIEGIAKAAEGEGVNGFEQRVAHHACALIAADNDVEAAYAVPFVSALCPFSEETQRQEFGARMATIDTMIGSTLLVEASRRLAERIPVWMFARMPTLAPAGAEPGPDDET